MRVAFSFLLFFLISCKEEPKLSKEAFLKMAQEVDPTVTVVLPRNLNEGISCAEYSEGCLAGHIVKVKGLNLIAVEFMTQDQAIYGAQKYRGYYMMNWLLDDVVGEPILERFVEKNLKAKRP